MGTSKSGGSGTKGDSSSPFKTVYLVGYNLIQWLAFSYVVGSLVYRLAINGLEGVPGAYQSVATVFRLLFIGQSLEILNPLLGVTRGSPFAAMVQIGFRSFLLFALIDAEPRVQDNKSVAFLILTWSVGEVIRYPYYLVALLGGEDRVLTWLRYSAWILLFPIGFTLEAIVTCQNLYFLEESQRLSLLLPNPFNVSFSLPIFLKMYLSIGIWIGGGGLLSYMYAQRKKVLRGPSSSTSEGKSK
jgi:very-long-chain (3R)-3-hydroxyacyl-CoA dehydratase